MALKVYKPTSPGRRGRKALDNSALWKGRPHKTLTHGISSTGGRNNYGRMTVRRGGGAKRLYRIIDFKNNVEGSFTVQRIEYDPNRTSNIMLVQNDKNKNFSYLLHIDGIKEGDVLFSSQEKIDSKIGNRMPLKFVPLDTIINSIELKKGKGAQMVRSAGAKAKLVSKNNGYAHIELGSKEVRKVHLECCVTIGQISNIDHNKVIYGKAGVRRLLGYRPITRGVAKNPVDHVMGGGEGKTSGRANSPSKWGTSIKGVKTRRNKRTASMIVKRKIKKGRKHG